MDLSKGINIHSEDWATIREWAQVQVEQSRKVLESPSTPGRQANIERGMILALNKLLALPETLEKRKAAALTGSAGY